MTLSDFKTTLTQTEPPTVSLPLQALWHEGKGRWHTAHDLLQDEMSGDGAWVHAYLHRKEGDLANAAYWYRRANQPVATGTLDEEWDTIANTLLSQTTTK